MKNKKEKRYIATDDPVMRTLFPKAAIKHDVNMFVAEIAGKVAKETWKGIRGIFSSSNKRRKK